jgi:hypothetical protein
VGVGGILAIHGAKLQKEPIPLFEKQILKQPLILAKLRAPGLLQAGRQPGRQARMAALSRAVDVSWDMRRRASGKLWRPITGSTPVALFGGPSIISV